MGVSTRESNMKKLYRSRKNRVIAGVCGGLGEYLGIDPTLIRLLWVLFIFMGGSGVIVYIIAMIIIPEKTEEGKVAETYMIPSKLSGLPLILLGLMFLFMGTTYLIWHLWLRWQIVWSIFLIIFGIAFLLVGLLKTR